MTEEEIEKQKRDYYRSIYDVKSWLSLHVTQQGYVRNLILTFCIALLAYGLNLYSKTPVEIRKNYSWGISGLFILSSIFIGLVIASLQAENFRRKRTISRIIEKNPYFMDTDTDFINRQKICTKIETWINYLVPVQIMLFFISLVILSFIIFNMPPTVFK